MLFDFLYPGFGKPMVLSEQLAAVVGENRVGIAYLCQGSGSKSPF